MGEAGKWRRKRAVGPLVYRQSLATRITHWVWAICLFFLLLSGLQIFNAHPTLYVGEQSGFEFDNSVLAIGAVNSPDGPRGQTRIFPGALTIPSYRDLGTGRVVHFFFGWVFLGTMLVWFVASLVQGHLRRDIVPGVADLKAAPGDLVDHARFRLHNNRTYGPVQKITYFIVLFVLFPLIVLTGLSMSPGLNAAWPWMLDLFGGRQTARTLHFGAMVLLVLFFVVHIVMVLAAGPVNELRSMVTGWYRLSAGHPKLKGDKP
ncbi:MAG: hypothetical protein K0R85_2581 [Devosia sp.]|nr:hypothetical protein [Devosia sp.]